MRVAETPWRTGVQDSGTTWPSRRRSSPEEQTSPRFGTAKVYGRSVFSGFSVRDCNVGFQAQVLKRKGLGIDLKDKKGYPFLFARLPSCRRTMSKLLRQICFMARHTRNALILQAPTACTIQSRQFALRLPTITPMLPQYRSYQPSPWALGVGLQMPVSTSKQRIL